MFNAYKSITRDRATMERTRVVLSSMLEDAKLDEAFESVNEGVFEGVEDDEIDKLLDRIPESDDNEENEEIDRIVDSEEDLDVDEILGIKTECLSPF